MNEIVVVGAGIAGLVAATELEAAGRSVVVLDKGRGVGGRMATRRLDADGVVFDHGAQFFTTKSDEGAALVGGWRAAGAAEVWHQRLLTDDGESRVDGHERLRGVPSMTGPAKLLAGALRDVRTSTAVDRVEVIDGRWRCHVGDDSVDGEALVMTPPLPQTLALLDEVELGAGVRERLSGVAYHPCVAVLAILDGPASLPEPGAVRPADGPVEWVADGQAKGISATPALTVHLRPEPSAAWWDDPDATIAERALAAVAPWCRAEPVGVQVHRWRFARPVDTLPERSLVLSTAPPLIGAGDVYGGPLVEGAARSGLDAARRLVELLER